MPITKDRAVEIRFTVLCPTLMNDNRLLCLLSKVIESGLREVEAMDDGARREVSDLIIANPLIAKH